MPYDNKLDIGCLVGIRMSNWHVNSIVDGVQGALLHEARGVDRNVPSGLFAL